MTGVVIIRVFHSIYNLFITIYLTVTLSLSPALWMLQHLTHHHPGLVLPVALLAVLLHAQDLDIAGDSGTLGLTSPHQVTRPALRLGLGQGVRGTPHLVLV